uniref:Granulins domain-containing protein n=1 Tax=Monopterus albus TaxID=43700 RepID=A0A3Q3QAQ1_MONAL
MVQVTKCFNLMILPADSACPDGSTCCKTKDGDWACCPLPEAVCCEDFIHCCPNGQKCNLAAGTCDDGKSSVPWMEKVPAVSKQGAQVQDVPCNSTVSCRDGSTCCKNKDGDWACCPLPEAVCCADGSHCCPAHYKCNEEKTTCTKGDVVIPWYTKLPASSSVQTDASSVQCKDLSHCPEHNTCCQLFTGEWGCCPLQNVSIVCACVCVCVCRY